MEENLFPRPAVRRLLQEKFVQAWIHSDHPEKAEENKALQRRYMGFVANPVLITIDPTTRKEIDRKQWPMDEAELIHFLEQSLAKGQVSRK
jgi:hypothetical protein